MGIEQRYRISREMMEIANDLNHKYITEQANITKLQAMAKELVEDVVRDGERTLIED
jgi:pyruvate/2-oxoglutarate dehydrogenase complex dihydrolipoamide acyltransferase (E2) component